MPSQKRFGKNKSTLRRREKKHSRKTRKNRGKKAGGPQTKQLVDALTNLENLLTGETRDSDNSVTLFKENVVRPISMSNYVAKNPVLLQKLNNIYSSNINNETDLIIQMGACIQLLPEIYNIVLRRKEIEDRKAMMYISDHKDLNMLRSIIFDRIMPLFIKTLSDRQS